MRRILFLTVIIVISLLGFVLDGSALADIPAQEMPLSPNGSAVEIHTDTQGNLWISEFLPGKIWKVTAAGDGYTAYTVGGFPADAQPDGQGGVWWVDSNNSGNYLDRLNLADNTIQVWNVDVSTLLWGLGFDASGKIWLTDSSIANIYRFDPSNRETCTYPLPTSLAVIYYPLVISTQLWLADNNNGQLLRLDFSGAPEWTSWLLPAGSTPYFLTQDASGNIWATDNGLAQLDRLSPTSGELTLYPLPAGTLPTMLTYSAGKIWYTEQSLASIGSLDPSMNSAQPDVATPATTNASFSCVTLDPPTTGSASVSSGVPSWTAASYPTIKQESGWTVYQLPANSLPNGIVLQNNQGFATDTKRHVLIRFAPSQPKIFLPLVFR